MKKFLLPRWTRYIGLVIIVPMFIYFFIDPDFVGYEPDIFDFNIPVLFYEFPFSEHEGIMNEANLLNELLLSLALLASWLIGFSRVKVEDEYTWLLRLESMVLALFINLLILFVTNFIIFGTLYLWVMMFQLFIFPLLFSLVFALRLQKQKRFSDEK